jgi:hypothetical protein
MDSRVPFRREALIYRFQNADTGFEAVRLVKGVVIAAVAFIACLLLLVAWLFAWTVEFPGQPAQSLMHWLVQQSFESLDTSN